MAVHDKMRLESVLERLGTAEGQRMMGELLDHVSPFVADKPMLEPFGDVPLPEDRFERSVVEQLYRYFIRGSDAGTYLYAAIGDVLDRAKQDDGLIDTHTILQQLGPTGLQFLERLAAVPEDATRDKLTDRFLLDRKDPTAHARLVKSSELEFPTLDAMEYFLREVIEPDEFESFKLLSADHLLWSMGSLYEAFNRTGASFADMRLVGKIYSTNFRAADHLEGRGAGVPPVGKRLPNPACDYSTTVNEECVRQLEHLIGTLPHPPEENPEPCVVLMDDGEGIIRLLNQDPELSKWAGYFVCVEKTRRGSRTFQGLDLKCAVCDVADSWAKLVGEMPSIGHSVLLELNRKLDELELYGVVEDRVPKEAVVVGNGGVGSMVARELADRGYIVHVVEDDPDKLVDLPEGMVPHTSLEEALPHAHVFAGCVGDLNLDPRYHALLPDHAILLNAASADTELGNQALHAHQSHDAYRDDQGFIWSWFRDQPVCLGFGEDQAHSDMVVNHPSGKELYVINQGFPIDFTGEKDPIPPRYIQVIRVMMMLGAVAAKRAAQRGEIGKPVQVPMEWQKALINFVQMQLRRTGEDLFHPNWEKHDGYPQPFRREPPAAMLEERRR